MSTFSTLLVQRRRLRINTSLALALLLALFGLRVIGQIMVALFHVPGLPPMQEWYSGLMPYYLLLPCQVVIMFFCSSIVSDLAANAGFFSRPNKTLGKWLLSGGIVYFLSMILRYIIHMTIHPAARWFGGSIPIIFHCVLACFVSALGWYHKKASEFTATAQAPDADSPGTTSTIKSA